MPGVVNDASKCITLSEHSMVLICGICALPSVVGCSLCCVCLLRLGPH